MGKEDKFKIHPFDKGPFTKDVRADGGRGVWKIRTNSDIGGGGGGFLAIRMSEI
jgi:hypothetical protein